MSFRVAVEIENYFVILHEYFVRYSILTDLAHKRYDK